MTRPRRPAAGPLGRTRVAGPGSVLLLLALAAGGCAQAGSGGAGGEVTGAVQGEVVATDDTGRPDSPAAGGWVVAVPEPSLDRLWRRVGHDRPDDLAHGGLPVDRAVVEELGGVVAPVGDDGRFTLDAVGPHLVCRLTSEEADGVTTGCAEVDLATEGTLRLSQGEGGFVARLR